MSPNVKRRSRVRAPNSSFYVSHRDRFREFLKGVIRVPRLTAERSSDGRRDNLSSLTSSAELSWDVFAYAKLSEESMLSICKPSIVNNWPSIGALSSEREISVRKTSCHDVVEYQFQWGSVRTNWIKTTIVRVKELPVVSQCQTRQNELLLVREGVSSLVAQKGDTL